MVELGAVGDVHAAVEGVFGRNKVLAVEGDASVDAKLQAASLLVAVFGAHLGVVHAQSQHDVAVGIGASPHHALVGEFNGGFVVEQGAAVAGVELEGADGGKGVGGGGAHQGPNP